MTLRREAVKDGVSTLKDAVARNLCARKNISLETTGYISHYSKCCKALPARNGQVPFLFPSVNFSMASDSERAKRQVESMCKSYHAIAESNISYCYS